MNKKVQEQAEKVALQAQSDAEEFKSHFAGLKVKTKTEYVQATDDLKEIKGAIKELKNKKDSVVKPMKMAVKEIEGWFKPALLDLQAAAKDINHGISDYVEKKEKQREKNLQKAQKAAKRGANDLAVSLISEKVEVEAVADVSRREKWEFVVVDEDAIPREFMIPDLAEIGRHVRANKDRTDIPGIKIKRSFTTVVRT